MDFKVIKPHSDSDSQRHIIFKEPALKIFLAGTIDMGNSEDWQSRFINRFIEIKTNKNRDRKSYTVQTDKIYFFNPRRDSGEGFAANNKSEMDYQINWELDHLENSNCIIMNLLPDSKSPISLMELGLFAQSKEIGLFVICPPSFYRYDNVRVVCKRYNIPLYTSEEKFFETMNRYL